MFSPHEPNRLDIIAFVGIFSKISAKWGGERLKT
jgi:hypothetical protein